ncbi:MAG: hypothetical protein F6K56_42910 [Moorea sp. SIO3G5]|nr:hypothetical protein [Moorena sp. SIO3G5]
MPTIICKVSCCGGQKYLYISVHLLMLGILPTLQTTGRVSADALVTGEM